MTTDYLYELQQAIITELSGDSTLDAMINGIYNHVPVNVKVPYISVDKLIARDVSTRTTGGFHVEMSIKAFSRNRSSQEASNILAEIRRILDAATISPTGCSVTSLKEDEDSITRMRDGVTWLGEIKYLVILQEGASTFIADATQFLLKVGDGATPTENFTTIGGIRNANLSLKNKILETTNLTSGKWQELVASAGIASIIVAGEGFFSDSTAEETLRSNAFSGSINNYKIELGNNNTITGGFIVASYKRHGDSKGEEEFSVSLESSGTIVFA